MAERLASIAKISRPRIRGVFPRERLFGLLDETRKYPVTWISAPAGSGKTVLTAGYLEAKKIPCLWYQMDGGDADPATFFYYMTEAAKKASPRNRKLLPLLTQEYLQDIPTFTLRYFENFFSRLKTPGVVVFDNYQEVPIDSPLHDIILNGLSSIPEEIQVIMISRSDPPPGLIRLRANHLMEVLGWNELRLTSEESQEIIHLRAKQKLSKETTAHLHSASEGWAAGLVLMLESMKKGIEPQMLGKLTPEEIVDYFASEIFNKTDQEIQKFFLKTAFLPKMTGKMAEKLTDLPSANRILAASNRNNYFTERSIQNEPVYQYHALYRAFLLLRARETFSPNTLLTLIRRAADLLEEDGQTEAAIALFQETGDWDEIVRLILKYAPSMVGRGQNKLLQGWLEMLPLDILENNPWLLSWMGECRLPYEVSISKTFFERAFEGFKNRKETAGMFQSWATVVFCTWLECKEYSAFDHWLKVFEDLHHDHEGFPAVEIEAWVATMMVTILMFRQPWRPELDTWADRALSLLEVCRNNRVRLTALFLLAYYRCNTGQMGKASHLIISLRQLWSLRDAPPMALILGKYIEAFYYRYLGMHEEVMKDVSEGLELSLKTGVHTYDHWFLILGATSALNVHDFKTAEKLLEKEEAALSRVSRLLQECYHIQRTGQALAQKDTRQASYHIDRALKLVTEVGSQINLTFALIKRSQVMHEIGKYKEAVDCLTQASDVAYRSNNKLQQLYILWTRAWFAFDEGKESLGISFLREALAIGREEGIIEASIYHPPTMSMLCAKALEAEIEVEFVQKLIKKKNLAPEIFHLHLKNWPWPLKIFTLGHFAVLKDGQPVQFSRKVQQRPLSVLKAIIAFGGREVREDQIMDALWPEADGDMANQSLATNLHRLRQLLGYEGAIQRQEGKLTLNERFCWVDTWAFEAVMGQAETLMKDRKPESAFPLIEKAMGIYKGPFLDKDVDQPWTISLGERLRNKLLRNVEKLGEYYQVSGQWEKALDGYLKGLEIDDLAEEFYSGLMSSYNRLGRKTDALAVYRRYQKTLSTLPGFESSPKIETLYKTLIAK